MKKITILITLFILCAATLFAQAPEKFSYQAVVRNASNALVTNAPVGVRVSILQGGVNGTLVYMETQTTVTNANGLISLQIGSGNVQQGSFADIDWANGTYFLKTEIDPAGGTNYSVTSTQQLLSVPYALYAKEAGNASAVPTNVSAFTNDVGYITSQDIPEIPTVPTNISAFTNDAGYITGYAETDPQFNAWDKDYNDLINKPTIPTVPTNVSAFTNDANYVTTNQLNAANYITAAQIPAQVNADWNATNGVAQILNKPSIPTVPANVSAFTNDAGYVTSTEVQQIAGVPTVVSAFQNDVGYITSAQVPAQVNADWNATNGVAQILNKPVLFSGNYNDLTNKPTLFSGNYNDLTNKPTIPVIPTNVSAFTNDAGYITSANIPTVPTNLSAFNNDVGYVTATQIPSQVNADWNATTGAALILNKPNLFSGNYYDLTNKPTIPTVPANVSAFNNDAGYITTSNIPSNVSVFNNDAHYITEAELNALLSSVNNTIDSLRDRIEELETNPPVPQTSAPTVTTVTVSNITATSAICGGNVTSVGSSTVTARGLCWSTSHNPTVNSNHTSDGSGTGSFTSNITGLLAGTTYYVRAYATNVVGTSYGSEVSFTTSTPFACGTSTVTDYDGNVYNTVQIGDQCWLKENLRSTHYADGTAIASGTNTSTTDAYYYPVSGDFYYGNLYNWKAVMGNAISSAANPSGVQGICPTGWHVPSDAEWNQLTSYVSSQSQYLCGSNCSTCIAKALASNSGWYSMGISSCAVGDDQSLNNSTGFTALPAGTYNNSNTTTSRFAYFRSATESSNLYAWSRVIGFGYENVERSQQSKSYGLSVRCVLGAGAFLTTPSVTTNTPANNVTSTTATCGGNVVSDGDATVTARGVCWSTSQSPTVSDSHTTDGSGTGSFTSNISGLSANTTYYVRAYATNSVGTAYGEQISFTTASNPVVTTNSISNVSTTSATCGGNVTSDGNATVTARGVCWNTSQNPTVSGNHTTNGNGTGNFTSNITGLSTNTMYYVRAYATNSVGTAYGEQRSFTTVGVPTVTTNSVSNITATTASCGGNVTSTGGASVTARGVCWSTSQNPTVSGSHTTDGSGSGSFTSNITGLSANTTYYVRAYATNSVGTVYGEQKTFTTVAVTQPTVTTSSVSNITTASVICGGNVTSDGNATVTARGVCWSTSQNPMVSGSHTTNGSGTGSFTSSITGLTANTTYYVRAYATNSVGTSYGEQRSFTTLSNDITVPSAPTGVTVTNLGTSSVPQIKVSWNAVSNATSYKVYRSSSTSGTFSQIGSATSNTYLYDNSPLLGYNYYKVTAVNNAGESSYSSSEYYNNTGGITVPSAPTGVMVTNMGTTSAPQIKISWDAVSNATSYRVYRSSTSGGTYSLISSPTSNTYLYDNSPLSGYNYYKVRAVNSAGESSYSTSGYFNNTSGITAPSTPTNVTATPIGTQILVSWTAVSNATSYKVYRSASANGSYTQVGTPTSNYWSDTNPLSGNNYYKVKAVNSAGESSYSTSVSVDNTTAPSVPTNVTVANTGTSSDPHIKVSWNAVANATNYLVYRSATSNGTFTQVGSATSYTYYYDYEPLSGYNYYKVKAVNSAGQSDFSTTVYFITVPSPPTNVTATNEGSSAAPHIKISWASASSATSYRVYRSSSSGGSYSQIGQETPNTYIYDDNPSSGHNYYKVKAVNSAGESNYSSYADLNLDPAGMMPCQPTVNVMSGNYSHYLSWTVDAGCGTPTSFQVWQFIPCTNQWVLLTTTTAHTYISYSVYPGINKYKVVAVNSVGSAEAIANTSSVPLSATVDPFWSPNVNGTCVDFSWSAVDFATGYEIWYSTNGGFSYYLDETIDDGNTTTLTKCYPQFADDIVSFKIRAFFYCEDSDPQTVPVYSDFFVEDEIWF